MLYCAYRVSLSHDADYQLALSEQICESPWEVLVLTPRFPNYSNDSIAVTPIGLTFRIQTQLLLVATTSPRTGLVIGEYPL